VSARPAKAAPAAPRFFATPAAWRAWLERHHATGTELWVGFRRRGSGLPSITWPESVDEALCFGWIDGLRRSLDEAGYVIRFTPRKPKSIWSDVNTKRYQQLLREGLVHASGKAAFSRREASRAGLYSFEQAVVELPPAYEKTFRANRKAWSHFSASRPSYRRAATWWVISARQEPTRARRLATLIADSAAGRLVPPLRPRPSAHAGRKAAAGKRG